MQYNTFISVFNLIARQNNLSFTEDPDKIYKKYKNRFPSDAEKDRKEYSKIWINIINEYTDDLYLEEDNDKGPFYKQFWDRPFFKLQSKYFEPKYADFVDEDLYTETLEDVYNSKYPWNSGDFLVKKEDKKLLFFNRISRGELKLFYPADNQFKGYLQPVLMDDFAFVKKEAEDFAQEYFESLDSIFEERFYDDIFNYYLTTEAVRNEPELGSFFPILDYDEAFDEVFLIYFNDRDTDEFKNFLSKIGAEVHLSIFEDLTEKIPEKNKDVISLNVNNYYEFFLIKPKGESTKKLNIEITNLNSDNLNETKTLNILESGLSLKKSEYINVNLLFKFISQHENVFKDTDILKKFLIENKENLNYCINKFFSFENNFYMSEYISLTKNFLKTIPEFIKNEEDFVSFYSYIENIIKHNIDFTFTVPLDTQKLITVFAEKNKNVNKNILKVELVKFLENIKKIVSSLSVNRNNDLDIRIEV